MIRSGLILMIKEKAAKGKSPYTIGNEIGVSKNTAKKYMTSTGTCHGLKGIQKASKLDIHKPLIHDLLEQGIYNCVVLLERLREAGYDGGISILKEYVSPLRPARNTPAVRRYETPSGKQVQMDWGICQYQDSSGTLHKAPVFVMILGYSRVKYIEFTSRCDLASMERCMVNAFTYFGGVPSEVLTDNMKTVVIGRELGKPIWNTKFADFAVDIGFVPKVCRVRMPQTKGKVERLVRYVRENFFPGRKFEDLEDLNRQALHWCRTADTKKHGTTGKIPLHELPQEALQPLPTHNVLDRYRWEQRLVARDSTVSFDGIRYGVPWQYAGREVHVRLLDEQVEIHCGETIVSTHKVERKNGSIVWLKDQYKGLAERKGIALAPSIAQQVEKTVEIRPLSIYDNLLGGVANG